MNYKNIKVEKRENYAIIEIANNKNNSLDQKTLNEIGDATKNLNKSKEIKCIGLNGGPKFFSPGADIKELEKLDKRNYNLIEVRRNITKTNFRRKKAMAQSIGSL